MLSLKCLLVYFQRIIILVGILFARFVRGVRPTSEERSRAISSKSDSSDSKGESCFTKVSSDDDDAPVLVSSTRTSADGALACRVRCAPRLSRRPTPLSLAKRPATVFSTTAETGSASRLDAGDGASSSCYTQRQVLALALGSCVNK